MERYGVLLTIELYIYHTEFHLNMSSCLRDENVLLDRQRALYIFYLVNVALQLRMTPLHWAVEREHVDTVEVLLQNGANPHEVSKFDKTSFHIAQDNNRQDIVQLLQAAAERLSPLQTLSASAADQAMEDATLTATQSLAVELAQVPTPAHQEEVQTSATASSTAGLSHITEHSDCLTAV
jgi:FOG: Ankyrin repeat